MACYWDTSALLALLFKEPASNAVRALIQEGEGLPGYTSFFTWIEMESAYARRLAEGSITSEGLSALRLESQRLECALALVWPDAETLADARRLVLEMGLRPADALQLACALVVARQEPGTPFASLDRKLVLAARAAGLEAPLSME